MAEAVGYPSGLRAAVMAGEAALERGPNHGLVCLEPRHLFTLLQSARLELAGPIVRASEGADAASEAPAHAQAPRTDAGADGETRAAENVAPAGAGTVGLRRVRVGGGQVSVDVLGDVAQRAHVALPTPDGRVLELSPVGLEWALLEHAYRWSDAWLVEWGSPVGEYAPQPKVLPLRPDLPIAPLADVQGPRHCGFCQSAPCQCPPVHDDDLLPSAQRAGPAFVRSTLTEAGINPVTGELLTGVQQLNAAMAPVLQRSLAQQQAMAAALAEARADAPHVAVLAAALRQVVPYEQQDDDETVTRAVRMWVQIVRELRDGGVA